jgi:osmotically-inducible protein OsmY
MIRGLLKLVLLVVILAAAVAFFLGYRSAAPSINTDKAREAGARIGETVASGAAKAQEALNEGALTAKIKSKMALDDAIDASSINVDTNGTVVTLSGSVRSETERAKAVQLARETAGVTTVNDRLVIK